MTGAFERLSAVDAVFLAVENDRDLMHVGFTAIFEKGPLRKPDGRLDTERIRSYSRAVLASLPKFRKKLARVPLLHHPVLVDDDRFDLDAHLRFVSLEHESTEELRDLVSRIYSEPLDRTRPLWEIWVVDGLPGDDFAIVTKTHHCMVDGVSGIAVFAAMLRGTPDASFDPEARWEIEPALAGRELLNRELRRVVRTTRDAVRATGRDFRARARAFTAGVNYAVQSMMPTVTRTSLNPSHVGPTRTFAWTELDIAAVKGVKNAASTTVNDVVLATVTGAIRTFLSRRGEDVDHIRFRALVPVSTHELGKDSLENDVAFLLVPLPLAEPDPQLRLALVSRAAANAKSSGEVQAVTALEKMADLASFSAITAFVRAVAHLHLYNVIVTNIRGPDIPLYFLGARLRGAYPLVPLYGDNAIGIALLSCGGKLFWGFNADDRRVPDVAELVEDVRRAFAELESSVTV